MKSNPEQTTKKEFLQDLPAVLLHPQTVVHSLTSNNLTDAYMSVVVSFTAPLYPDFSSEEYDSIRNSSKTWTPCNLRLLGAMTHSDAVLEQLDKIEITDTAFSATVIINTLTKPDCFYQPHTATWR